MPGATLGDALRLGAAAGLVFHPLASAGALVVSGALMGTKRAARWRVVAALAVLAAAWSFADGRLVLDYANGATAAGDPVPWAFVGSWALVGFAAGYLLPALAGRFVGTRVTHGTGWVSAIAIGVGLSIALGSLGGGGVLWFAR